MFPIPNDSILWSMVNLSFILCALSDEQLKHWDLDVRVIMHLCDLVVAETQLVALMQNAKSQIWR